MVRWSSSPNRTLPGSCARCTPGCPTGSRLLATARSRVVQQHKADRRRAAASRVREPPRAERGTCRPVHDQPEANRFATSTGRPPDVSGRWRDHRSADAKARLATIVEHSADDDARRPRQHQHHSGKKPAGGRARHRPHLGKHQPATRANRPGHPHRARRLGRADHPTTTRAEGHYQALRLDPPPRITTFDPT